MFAVRPDDIERLRSPGGDHFAHFVNDLISAHSKACGIPASMVHLNCQTNVGDGGVDAEVARAAIDDPLGWLAHPSIWQFKASSASGTGPEVLKAEIEKWFASERIQDGYVYYACICDQLTQAMRSRRESALLQAARAISPFAPTPHVIDANDLARFVSQYPAVVLRHFRSEIEGLCLPFREWEQNVVGQTGIYFKTPEVEASWTRIEEHLSFGEQPRDAVLVVRGEAGVGKTRLVFEGIRQASDAELLSVFAVDEESASRLATLIVNSSLTAIVVADEITAGGIAQLRKLLNGHRSRVRVIAIESVDEEYRRDDDEAIWVEQLPSAALEEVLGENFPQVPAERRRAYAYLAEGTIRFAVELCRQHREVAIDPGILRTTFVADYIRQWLSMDERDAVEAVSLLHGVGWRDEVSDELTRLCALLDVNEERVRRSAARLRDAPGFIAAAGRYWYVKPPIVAQAAFADAWQRWASFDQAGFLGRIAASGFLEPFIRQVARIGSGEVRRSVGEHWFEWANTLGPESLARGEEASLLLTLVEVDPNTYLPILRRLTEEADPSILVDQQRGDRDRREARHELVRLARRVAILPEYFHEAEAILLGLALAESGDRIADSASRTYVQLFRIFLSGTSLPFEDRLIVLGYRARSTEPRVALLAVHALCNIFEPYHSRGVDEPTIAGRITLEDWQPLTHIEWHRCFEATIAQVHALVESGNAELRRSNWGGLLPRIGFLMASGFAGAINALFPADLLPIEQRERVVVELEAYLKTIDEVDDENVRHRLTGDEEDELRALIQLLRPVDIQGRLGVALAANPWSVNSIDPDSAWRSEVRELAGEFVQRPEEFPSVLDSLFLTTLATAHEVGTEFGGQDPNGVLLDVIMSAMSEHEPSNFPLGYIKGLTEVSITQDGRLSQFLNGAATRNAKMVFYLAASAGDRLQALTRMLRLVDAGAVPASHLSAVANGLKGRWLTDEELEQVATRLTTAAERGEKEAGAWGIRFLHQRFKDESGANFAQEPALALLAWRLIEATASDSHGEASLWGELFKTLAANDWQRASKIAANVLGSGSWDNTPVATKVLIELAKLDPQLVMTELGRVMLDAQLTYRFSFYSHTDVFEALPPEVVEAWLDTAEEEGAEALAGHLPLPRLIHGRQFVPRLTESVLKRYGHNRTVLEEFCRATASGSRIFMEDLHEGLKRRRTVAGVAREFEANPDARIREWAREVQKEVKAHERWVAQLDEEDTERRLRY